jgi:hypothetical protein
MAKTGAQNAITDDNFGTELPVTQIDDALLINERNMAKFSKTKEYRALKEYMEARIEFFQTYLPDGNSINGGLSAKGEQVPHLDNKTIATYWRAANIVIGEFKSVLQAYEQAAEAVKNADAAK